MTIEILNYSIKEGHINDMNRHVYDRLRVSCWMTYPRMNNDDRKERKHMRLTGIDRSTRKSRQDESNILVI